MPTAKRSWNDKLKADKKPILKRIDFDFADIPANSNMYISTPLLIEKYIQQIPEGRAVSVQTMRKDLAIDNNAEYTCPVTTGIFLRIVAEAAWEQYQQGKKLKEITPFWRVVEPGSALAKKLSCGEEFLVSQRKKEKLSSPH
jgi:hypothetical protein